MNSVITLCVRKLLYCPVVALGMADDTRHNRDATATLK